MRNFSVRSVEDLGDFFEGGSLGFNVEEEYEDEFEADPDLFVFGVRMGLGLRRWGKWG